MAEHVDVDRIDPFETPRVEITVNDDGTELRFHRTDLPAVADPAGYDVFASFEQVYEAVIRARQAQLSLDDITGGL